MTQIAEKILTKTRRGSRMLLVEEALAVLVSQALAGRSVHEGAILCGLPDHQLRDVVYGKSKRPSPAILRAIESGLGVAYEDLALAAYGVIPRHKAEAVPA